MASVNWMRPELRQKMRIYLRIRDVLAGAQAIKGYDAQTGATFVSGVNGYENVNVFTASSARRYLPQPNPEDRSIENVKRYAAYVERAQWLGATSRTLQGLTGQVFERDPMITLPDELKAMLENIDGGGVSAFQQMQKATSGVIAYGRAGLLTDFMRASAPVTKADIANGTAVPIITLYTALNIINWRVQMDGTKKNLVLLVLRDEDVFSTTDLFESLPVDRYRVLRIEDNGDYSVETWENDPKDTDKTKFSQSAKVFPTDNEGKRLKEIPFQFIGAENNDEVPDKPPLEDLAEVNIGHYRNSADYEESIYMLGQPTPYASGLTPTWYKEIWKGKNVPLGARAFIPLPVGGEIGLVEASPNTMAHEGMIEKQNQMIMLGAKLVENTPGQQTATGELIDETSETSVLSNAANNVSNAYAKAFRKARAFIGPAIPNDDLETVKVTLNTSFQLTRMTAADRQESVAEWQKGAIAWPELRAQLRGAGLTTMSDDDALDYIKQEQAEAIATGVVFSTVGVELPALAAPGGIEQPGVNAPPPGQAGNPNPPRKGPVAKEKPRGKGNAK